MTRYDTGRTKRLNVLMLILLSLVVILFVYFLYTSATAKTTLSNGSATAGTSTNNSNNSGAVFNVLSPATVPPKTAECDEQLSYSSDGTISPLICSNGDINSLAWNSLAALEPTALKLGYSPSASVVQSALCNDVKANISNAIEQEVYIVASAYYGWSFGQNPSSVLSNGSCVNADD